MNSPPGFFLNSAKLFGLFILLTFSAIESPAAKLQKNTKKVPAWVLDCADNVDMDPAGDSGYVVLHDSRDIEVGTDGKTRIIDQLVVKIVDLSGRSRAVSHAVYSEDTDKVQSMDAWVLRPDGKAVIYDKSDVVDRTSRGQGSIVSSQRTQSVDASGDVSVGSVFASETVTIVKGTLLSWRWYFRGPAPSAHSKVRLRVPGGWKVDAHFAQMEPLEAERGADTYLWEMRDLAPAVYEDWAPEESSPWMNVSVAPPEGSSLREKFIDSSSWAALSIYFTERYDRQIGDKSVLEEKVRKLTVDCSGLWEKVRALSEFARSVNYVALELDLGTGGGRIPREAAEVCSSNYGDCKDKSSMLSHLLALVGVKAYPVIVNAGLRHEVDAAWPSAGQFNHCIIAIEAPAEFENGSVFEHAELGRLLIFDPTDEFTALGDLPKSLQGSRGLLLAGKKGGLIELPLIAPERNVTKRNLEAELFDDGSLIARMKEQSFGQMARNERRAFNLTVNSSDYEDRLRRRITSNLSNPRVTAPKVKDDLQSDEFNLEVDFGSLQYGKTMGGALIIFKPVILDRTRSLPFVEEDGRTLDIVLPPTHLTETSKIYIPSGFRVSESEDLIEIEQDFGSYSKSVTIHDDHIICERRLFLPRTWVDADRFDEVVTFYEQIEAADEAAIVLEKL